MNEDKPTKNELAIVKDEKKMAVVAKLGTDTERLIAELEKLADTDEEIDLRGYLEEVSKIGKTLTSL
jgi:hypothetical protein